MALASDGPKTFGWWTLDRQVERLRRYFTDHKLYGTDVAEIPVPMLRQLVREGVNRAKGWYGGVLALSVLPNLGKILDGKMVALAGVILAACISGTIFYNLWPWITMQPLERELMYRRQHGKWRWER